MRRLRSIGAGLLRRGRAWTRHEPMGVWLWGRVTLVGPWLLLLGVWLSQLRTPFNLKLKHGFVSVNRISRHLALVLVVTRSCGSCPCADRARAGGSRLAGVAGQQPVSPRLPGSIPQARLGDACQDRDP